jgi:hypothetical protein
MKSNDFCETTLDALTSQLCVLDANGVIIFVNAAWLRFADENPPAPANYSLLDNHIEVCDRASGKKTFPICDRSIAFEDGGIRKRLSEQLSSFDETLESIILDLRALVTRLRPALLESAGIIATMEYEVREFERSTGVSAQFISGEREPGLDIDTSLALYRILQEALSNIRRHAHAAMVIVRCERTDGLLQSVHP